MVKPRFQHKYLSTQLITITNILSKMYVTVSILKLSFELYDCRSLNVIDSDKLIRVAGISLYHQSGHKERQGNLLLINFEC